MIDTHCHLTDPRLLGQVDDVVRRAGLSGVRNLITIGTDLADARNALKLTERLTNVRCAIGIHPGHCGDATDDDLSAMGDLLTHPGVVAAGEMGLDYHYQPVDRDRQIRFFQAQLNFAQRLNLPVVIHSRESVDDSLAVMKDFPTVRGVFHCFTGTADEAGRILDRGYWLGFTGVVTFKKSDDVRAACLRTPDDRLLVETDAPWLSPDPVRNQKINEPAFVMHTARKVAQIRNRSLKELDEMTTRNTRELFGWPE